MGHVAGPLRDLTRSLTGAFSKEGQSLMRRIFATAIACCVLLSAGLVKAQNQPDKATVKQATATCRAEVKEHAKYNEMSLWAQHKAVKKCVAEALAKH
jgi:hypothetical protein